MSYILDLDLKELANIKQTNKQINKQKTMNRPPPKKVPIKVHFLYPKDQRVEGLT